MSSGPAAPKALSCFPPTRGKPGRHALYLAPKLWTSAPSTPSAPAKPMFSAVARRKNRSFSKPRTAACTGLCSTPAGTAFWMASSSGMRSTASFWATRSAVALSSSLPPNPARPGSVALSHPLWPMKADSQPAIQASRSVASRKPGSAPAARAFSTLKTAALPGLFRRLPSDTIPNRRESSPCSSATPNTASQ